MRYHFTPSQRRAIWAKRQDRKENQGPTHQTWPKLHRFPLRGSGGTSQRNRALVYSAVAGVGTVGLAGAAAYGRFNPIFKGVTSSDNLRYPPGGGFDAKGKPIAVGHASRIADPKEASAYRSLMRWIGPRRVHAWFGGRGRVTLEGDALHGEAPPARGTSTWKGVRKVRDRIGSTPMVKSQIRKLAKTYEVPAGSAYTRVSGEAKAAIGRRMEHSSLWNILGRGNLHELIENVSTRAQVLTAKKIPRWTRPVRRYVERKAGAPFRRLGRRMITADAQLAGGIRQLGSRIEHLGTGGRAAVVGGTLAALGAGGYGIARYRKRRKAS